MKAIVSIFAVLMLACTGCDQSSQARTAPAPLPRTIEGHGIIRGSVAFAGTAPAPRTIITTDDACAGGEPLMDESVIVNPNHTLRNVLVYLEDAPATDGSARPPVLIDQVRCRYEPHVIALQAGQTLNIRSSDATMHNVHFNPARNPAKNLSMTSAGQEVAVQFEFSEIIPLRCDVHPWMSAWVGVMPNSFFAATGDEGEFEIKGIPAGTYTLVAWHEIYGRREKAITVVEDEPIEADFVFGRQG